MRRVATVVALGRYPVKSMRGETLEEAEVVHHGILGDRRYAFVRADTPSSFPWLTGREAAELILYAPRFERPPTPEEPEPPLWVRTPAGDDVRVDDPRLQAALEERSGHPLFLLHTKIGAFDSAYLSLFGLPTLRQLSAEVGLPLMRERFRANLYIEPAGGRPFEEDAWVGRVLAIGDTVRVGVTKRNVRCAMTTLDPLTAAAEPAVLRAIAQRYQTCAGIYATVITPGVIRAGDPIGLID
jgi:hypothetical protein